jgi:2-polyprenyl-6-methoxyphenol hydroxylase-like FAD-dependent oxidoreductase
MTDVIIAGGGPIGLALAVELGTRGISCLVVEERTESYLHPKAQMVNARSMEHFRRWGIAEEVRDAAPLPEDYPYGVVFCTRLLGYELARFDYPRPPRSFRHDFIAEGPQRIPQYLVEPILARRASACPDVTLRTGWTVDGFTADGGGGVTVTLRAVEGGAIEIVGARFLAGCDGGHSMVRRSLGIEMVGEADISRQLGVFFRAPTLWDLNDKGRALLYWLVNGDVAGIMGPIDGHGGWGLQVTDIPPEVPLDSLDPVTLVHGAVGAEVPCEIITTQPWVAHRLVAERYRVGPVFLAGDAAHLLPPTGGFGMNTGIGDAVDLGWKLAAVIDGWGGARLLDSYDAERRPVGEVASVEAATNAASWSNAFVRPGIEDDTPGGAVVRAELESVIRSAKTKEFESAGLVLGYCYEGSPIVAADGTEAGVFDVTRYRPSARPGSRAPHRWLADGRSLYDVFGEDFTLLVLDGDGSDTTNFQLAAKQRGMPLAVLPLADDVVRASYDRRYALIRPDQHVAWRGDELPTEPGALLDLVRGA